MTRSQSLLPMRLLSIERGTPRSAGTDENLLRKAGGIGVQILGISRRDDGFGAVDGIRSDLL